MSLKQKTIRSAKWSAISTIVVVLFGFLQITLLSRIIPPHQFGILTIIIAITLLAETLSDFGISNSIIQQKDIDDQQLSTLYWINVLFGIFVFISFLFLGNTNCCLVRNCRTKTTYTNNCFCFFSNTSWSAV